MSPRADNYHLVDVWGDLVRVLGVQSWDTPGPVTLTRDDAANLAAWLIMIGDCGAQVDLVLKANGAEYRVGYRDGGVYIH